MNYNKGDIANMRTVEDETGEVYLSVTDIVAHLRGNQHRMNEVLKESVTADRFILLLQTFEKAVKEDQS